LHPFFDYASKPKSIPKLTKTVLSGTRIKKD
jgi:hypothetical protein